MAKHKLTAETRQALHESGLHISSLYRRPLNGRRVSEDGDPWTAQLFYPEIVMNGWPVPQYALFIAWADGDSADNAVKAALAKTQGLEGRYRKLGAAMVHLTEILRGARTSPSLA
jgi:hypothetical protein